MAGTRVVHRRSQTRAPGVPRPTLWSSVARPSTQTCIRPRVLRHNECRPGHKLARHTDQDRRRRPADCWDRTPYTAKRSSRAALPLPSLATPSIPHPWSKPSALRRSLSSTMPYVPPRYECVWRGSVHDCPRRRGSDQRRQAAPLTGSYVKITSDNCQELSLHLLYLKHRSPY
jgi:hypothetical protein